MPDGVEEREERKLRVEQQKLEGRFEDLEREDVIDWEPERPES